VIHDPLLLDALEQLDGEEWRGRVFRHVIGSARPELANLRGARWNPAGTQALYTSLDDRTAKAEGDQLISLQPIPPRAPRTIYELEIKAGSLLDLRDRSQLQAVGIGDAELRSDDWGACQRVGGAVAWLRHDALLVPSARDPEGSNLVIFVANLPSEAEIRTIGQRSVS
jgi:RES domain-containing protein